MDKKLGVVVPYRDRYEHLLAFKAAITAYLDSKKIPFELIVVEQDNAKLFNRGKLLNIGFNQAKKLRCDYVVFHDVDMIPQEVDYSYSDIPLLLATQRVSFDEFFSSVILFPIEYFEKINGYSNNYWGWGFEDDDLLFRCKVNNIPLDNKETTTVSGHTSALKFNGHNAYVESSFKPKGDSTVFILFEPQDIVLDHEKYDDDFVILTLPKHALTLSYDSYGKYKVLFKDTSGELHYINSERLNPYKTGITITIGDRKVEMYQDGHLVGVKHHSGLQTTEDRYFSVGTTFRGLVFSLAIYNKILNKLEVEEISENRYFGLTYFTSAQELITYYDSAFTKNYQLVDLSENRNRGRIYNCEIVKYKEEGTSILKVPFRRDSKFTTLNHENNGFQNGGWKDINTRYNQLKFNNEVMKGYLNTKEDGLNNCEYRIHSQARVANQTHLIASI